MEWTVAFQAEPRILIVQTAGIADAASTLAMVKNLILGAQEHQAHLCLIDHRALSGVSGGTFELYARPAQVRELGEARRVKIAEVIRPEHAPHFKFLEIVFHEDDDDDYGDEPEDDWDKAEEDDNWDPDFDEFDIPKSKTKKSGGGGKKKGGEDDDDFKLDDDFKEFDPFNDKSGGFDDDEDDDF